jgi:hypothetical protein
MNETMSGTEINESVLIERINRQLKIESQNEKESRQEQSPSFGHFYEHSDQVSERPGAVNLERIGRELDVLKPDETVKQ